MIATIKLSAPSTREFWEIPILHEDDCLLALDKPSGLLTSSDRSNSNRPNLVKLLHAAIERGAAWATEGGRTYLAPAHRLDFETSGVMLLAKSKPVLIALANSFGTGKPGRKYVALVQGSPAEDRFEIDAKLAPHPARIGLMRIDPKRGKRSCTVFEVIERFSGWTLLRCEPVPDRAHQIRAHLLSVGLPVVGDGLYGGWPLLLSRLKPNYRLKPDCTERPLIDRAALHVEAFALSHPVTHEPITITAPWPKNLRVAVKYLRLYSPP